MSLRQSLWHYIFHVLVTWCITMVCAQNQGSQCDGYFTFMCENSNCIYNGFECDGENDCGDMSDENNCDSECYTDNLGQDYRGYVSKTRNNKICQNWTSQTPHQHSRTPSNYPGRGLGNHNYCRNPDLEPGPWCFTTNPNIQWQYCNVGSPGDTCNIVDIPQSCGNHQLKELSGTITSPGYPLAYPNEARCTWIIQGPENTLITLNFTEIILQNPNRGSCYDWIQILEKNTDLYPEAISQQHVIYCGNHYLPTYTSSGNYLWLQFRSDDTVVKKGFSAEYRIVDRITTSTSTTASEQPNKSTEKNTDKTRPMSSWKTTSQTFTSTPSTHTEEMSEASPISSWETTSQTFTSTTSSQAPNIHTEKKTSTETRTISSMETTSHSNFKSTTVTSVKGIQTKAPGSRPVVSRLSNDATVGSTIGAIIAVVLLICIVAVVFYVKSRRSRKLGTTKTVQSNGLAFDGPYDVTVQDGNSIFAATHQENPTGGTQYHSNEAYQPEQSVPVDNVYHDIGNEANDYTYVVTQPQAANDDDANPSENVYEVTPREYAEGMDNDESGEGWVDNSIYAST